MASPRIRENIQLTSPSGIVFSPKWAGGTRTVKKRLARYSFAGVDGEIVDDYGCDAWEYPLQLIFDGASHDIDAKRFCDVFNAEKGQWAVNHPTNGFLGLQGVSVSENDQPISEANATRVDAEFVENLDPLYLKTLRNFLLELGIAVNEFNAAQTDKLTATIKLDPASVQEAKEASRSALASIKKGYARVMDANAQANDARNELLSKVNSGVIDAAGLVSSIQNAVGAPARALADIRARMDTFKNILDDLFGGFYDTPAPSPNDAAVKEVTAMAVVSVAARAVVTLDTSENTTGDPISAGVAVTASPQNQNTDRASGIVSRSSLLIAVDQINEVFAAARAGIDREAQKFIDEPIEDTYVPLGSTAPLLAKVEALTHRALQTQFFSLPTEINVVIRQDTPVAALAKKYHGTTGENDFYLRQIISSNKLKGSELLYIPPGRKVVIYGKR